jgi:hypothetical protein
MWFTVKGQNCRWCVAMLCWYLLSIHNAYIHVPHYGSEVKSGTNTGEFK